MDRHLQPCFSAFDRHRLVGAPPMPMCGGRRPPGSSWSGAATH